jgi:hypothetical protein
VLLEAHKLGYGIVYSGDKLLRAYTPNGVWHGVFKVQLIDDKNIILNLICIFRRLYYLKVWHDIC